MVICTKYLSAIKVTSSYHPLTICCARRRSVLATCYYVVVTKNLIRFNLMTFLDTSCSLIATKCIGEAVHAYFRHRQSRWGITAVQKSDHGKGSVNFVYQQSVYIIKNWFVWNCLHHSFLITIWLKKVIIQNHVQYMNSVIPVSVNFVS